MAKILHRVYSDHGDTVIPRLCTIRFGQRSLRSSAPPVTVVDCVDEAVVVVVVVVSQSLTSDVSFTIRRHVSRNSLFAGWQSAFDKLQRVLNCAARVIFGGDRRDDVTPLVRDKLHWLRGRERITFKLYLLVFKAINGLAPSYLQDLCVPVTTVYTRAALRSAARGDLVVPRTRRRLGHQAFCVAGPTAWNSLPSDIRTASSVTTFKNLLKTHLFIESYYTT